MAKYNLNLETCPRAAKSTVNQKSTTWRSRQTNKQNLLEIDTFWDNSTPDLSLRWEKLRVKGKLALIAKENIILDTLKALNWNGRIAPRAYIRKNNHRSSPQSEWERNARNAQQKTK